MTELKPPVITFYDEITNIVNDKRPNYEIEQEIGVRLNSPAMAMFARWLLCQCSILMVTI